MRIIFAGTPPFAARALQALIAAGHDICLVLSQPDRPSGRGMRLTPSAVKVLATENGIPVQTPKTLSLKKAPEEASAIHDLLRDAQADVMVVAAYGMLLPEAVLNIPKGIGPDNSVKCINIHASLLPRWRGAAPITRAIEAGDSSFGVTLMKMDVAGKFPFRRNRNNDLIDGKGGGSRRRYVGPSFGQSRIHNHYTAA